MLKVTPEATKAMNDHFQGKEKMPIRIFLKMGGCGMRSFGIAIEKIQASDQLFEIDGFAYIIEAKILQQYGPITINSDGFSFRISGNGIHPPVGCGTCGYGCGSRGGARCSGVCPTCEKPCPTGQRMRARRKVRV